MGWGGGALSRLAEPSERGCGERFVEMVIICCIDLAVARAAGTHTHTLTYTQARVAETDPFILIPFTFP